MSLKKDKSICKIQSNIGEYPYFVLKNLIGVHGKSVSDVVNFIINGWIENNWQRLDSMGIGFKDWKNESEENKNSPTN